MLHTITKQLETCIDINIEISWVDHYTWILTTRTFRLGGGWKIFWKKISWGRHLNLRHNCQISVKYLIRFCYDVSSGGKFNLKLPKCLKIVPFGCVS